MSSESLEGFTYQEPIVPSSGFGTHPFDQIGGHTHAPPNVSVRPVAGAPRRTPRQSLIFVMPGDRSLPDHLVTHRLLADTQDERMDVIVACAGEPRDLTSLQRRVRDLQVLLAPAGTSAEDLRQLAMERAPGDVVTLLSGFPPDPATDD